MKIRSCTISAAAILLTASQAWSAVLFVNDVAGYDTAIGALTSGGTENFETLFPTGGGPAGADLSILNGTVINASLGLRMTAQGGYLLGMDSSFGLDANSNSLWDGTGGNLTIELALSSGKPVQGLSLNVLSYEGSLGSIGTPDIQVYSLSGGLIGSGTVAASTLSSTSGFVGIVAGTGESIGRIVLTPTSGYYVGADNIAVAVPEPSAYALATGLCALGVGIARRFRRST